MLSIAEWAERYEVSSKNREAKPGDTLRTGPLRYIRLKVHGRQQGTGMRKLTILAGDKKMEVFGIFAKLLEVAGDSRQEDRGKLLDDDGNPADAKALAFIIDVPEKQMVNALSVLTNQKLGWIIDTNSIDTQLNTIHTHTQGCGGSPEKPGNTQKPPPVDELFESFWKEYPRKIGKGAAHKIWTKLKPSQKLVAQIMKAVEDQKQCDQWQRDSGQYIPHPSTWLNQQRWDDEPGKEQPSGPRTHQRSFSGKSQYGEEISNID